MKKLRFKLLLIAIIFSIAGPVNAITKKATLINAFGEKVVVSVDSQDAQEYFGIGYTLYTGESMFGAVASSPALFRTNLASKMTTSDTSMTLVSATTREGNTLSGPYCFTIDGNTSSAEFVCGTASGTSITALERGLGSDGTTEYTALKFTHRYGAEVKITDFPVLQRLTNIFNGDANVPGDFAIDGGLTVVDYVTATSADPTLDTHLVTRKYVTDYIVGQTDNLWTLNANLTDIYYATGSVSIGTSTLGKKLEVMEDDGTPAIRIIDTAGNTNNLQFSTTEIEMNRSDGSNTPLAIVTKNAGSWGTGPNAGDMIFYTDNTESVRIDQGGNVGIGSSSPDSKLVVDGTSKFTATSTFESYVVGAYNPTIEVKTTTGSWTVPDNVKKIRVRVQGGGADGGTSSSIANDNNFASGGGAGGYCEEIIDVTGTSTISYTVGGVGEASSFSNYCSANGGTIGNDGDASSYTTGGAGGTATGGDINISGEAGGLALSVSTLTGGGSIWITGKGGDSQLGIGGRPIETTSGVASGNDGTGYGAGGGGYLDKANGSNASGGDASPGVIIIEY